MTVEAAQPKSLFSITGIGPYGVPWPYGTSEVIGAVIKGGVRTALTASDFSMTPASATINGQAYLTPAAAATYAGGTLVLERVTAEEQGYVGAFPTEVAIAAQLDRLTRRVQEISRGLLATLRVDATVGIGLVADGCTLLYQAGALVPGPTAANLLAADANVAQAGASAAQAVASAASAAGSASAAAASAAQINLPAVAGKPLNLLRVNAGATGYEHRTPDNVRETDLGISGHGATAQTITDLNAQALGGTFFAASTATGVPNAEPVLVLHRPGDSASRAAQDVRGLTTGRHWARVKSAGTWGAWTELLTEASTTGLALGRAADATTALAVLGLGPLADAAAVAAGTAGRVVDAALFQSERIKQGTTVTAASQTAISFTSIPSWAKRISVTFNGLSLAAAGNILIRAGTGGTAQATGYNSSTCYIGTGGGGNTGASSTGFGINVNGASNGMSGSVILTKQGGNIWAAQGCGVGITGGGDFVLVGGAVSLSGALDIISIANTSGTTFDAGSVNISWE